MNVASVPTLTATIWVGLKHRDSGQTLDVGDAIKVCQAYCDRVSLCVTATPTTFIYKNGSEDGLSIGLINYPRFPSDPPAIRRQSIALARQLKRRCRQYKVTIVMQTETVMLSTEPKGGAA